MIRAVRSRSLQTVFKALESSGKGRKPFLQVIIDLTTLEKRGKFQGKDSGLGGLTSVTSKTDYHNYGKKPVGETRS